MNKLIFLLFLISNSFCLDIIPFESYSKIMPNLSEMKTLKDVNFITIHHSGIDNETDDILTLQKIEKIHISGILNNKKIHEKWSTIGYHFLISSSGKIYEGRKLLYQGAHVKNNNEKNIGICFMGNYDVLNLSDKQILSFENLINFLNKKYNKKLIIKKHNDFANTNCPGYNIDKFLTFKNNK